MFLHTHTHTHTHTYLGHDSKPNSLSRHMSPPNQKPLPVVSEVMFSGSMKIKVKDLLKSIERNSRNPITSDEFPRVKGHHGPRYEMRFFPSNFGKGNSSLYINVARSYLHKKAKNKEHRRPIEIPAMNVSVHLSYEISSEGGRGNEIKSEMLDTDVKTIDSQGEASSKMCVVASFPQLVSHAELGLSDTLADGRSSLVICVNMNARS